MAQIENVAVVGAGTMGSQIALQIAYSGQHQVTLIDSSPQQLAQAEAQVDRLLRRGVERGRLDEAGAATARGRIQTTRELVPAVADADLVIEAIFEDLDAKRALWRELGQAARPEALLASNSSTIAISRVVDQVPGPQRCCNMHFFHPVTVMKLCEVVRGPKTSAETVEAALAFVRAIDRVPVLLNKEVHGFIVNRLLFAAAEEAFHLLEGGYASVEDIDTAARNGLNWPMGPFEVLDFSGLDVFYGALEDRRRLEGGPGAPASLRDRVERGELGRKSGRGFYEYTDAG